MTAGDLRQQIMSNALVLYPNIVDQHKQTYPNVPIRPEDIFDICIFRFLAADGTGGTHWHATLAYAPGIAGITRENLLIGRPALAVEWALYYLLDIVSDLLSNRQAALLPFRGNSQVIADGECMGAIVRYDTFDEAVTYAVHAREIARRSEGPEAEREDAAQPTKMEPEA
jgi:hypothetical protein